MLSFRDIFTDKQSIRRVSSGNVYGGSPSQHRFLNQSYEEKIRWWKSVTGLSFLIFLGGLLYLTLGSEWKGPQTLERLAVKTRYRYAYLTLLCDDIMAEAAMVLVHSLKRTGTPHDVVILTMNVSNKTVESLQTLGAKIEWITDPVTYPFSVTADRLAINKPCRCGTSLWGKRGEKEGKGGFVLLLCLFFLVFQCVHVNYYLKFLGCKFALAISCYSSVHFHFLLPKLYGCLLEISWNGKGIQRSVCPIIWRFRYSKLLMWNMVQYRKIVYLDSDLLVLDSIDSLFEKPQLSAVPDTVPPDKFNSGLMVVEPNRATFRDMIKKVRICTALYLHAS